MKQTKKFFIAGIAMLVVFFAFTVCVLTVDRAPVGPLDSSVGFSGINQSVFKALGESAQFYQITEYLGYASLAFAAAFAILGVLQLIKRKSLWKVDRDILLLGVFYAVVLACYVAFEVIVINYRPVIPEGVLEASYPSSHTILTVCIMVSAIPSIYRRSGTDPYRKVILPAICVAVSVVTVVGRLLSGVHWLTDIIGGVLLSCALVLLYLAALKWADSKQKKAE